MNALKLAASAIVLVQTFRLALLQDSTDSPGRTIDKSWLREQKPAPLDATTGDGQVAEFAAYGSGIPEGFQSLNPEEEQLLLEQAGSGNGVPYEDPTSGVSDFENGTTVTPDTSDDANSTTASAGASQHNGTEFEQALNSTTAGDDATVSQGSIESTTTAPENKTTTGPEVDEELTNSTGANDTAVRYTTAQSTVAPVSNNGSQNTTGAHNATVNNTVVVSTTGPVADNGTGSNVTTAAATPELQTSNGSIESTEYTTSQPFDIPATDVAPGKPGRANKTGTIATGSEGVWDSDPHRSKRSVAWLAVLGTLACVALVGFVVYSVMKKKQRKAFSHRKLVEEYPSEPVLRLDNGEPLDLSYGTSGYHNPGLQGDDIQMSNLPGRH